MGATLLVCLFGACLNPMPEEFPSNDSVTIEVSPGTNGMGGGASGVPSLPDSASSGSGGDFIDRGSDGASSDPSVSEPSPGADGEAAPDAGADASAPTVGGSDSEGETAP